VLCHAISIKLLGHNHSVTLSKNGALLGLMDVCPIKYFQMTPSTIAMKKPKAPNMIVILLSIGSPELDDYLSANFITIVDDVRERYHSYGVAQLRNEYVEDSLTLCGEATILDALAAAREGGQDTECESIRSIWGL
jgi:hypothetical protein